MARIIVIDDEMPVREIIKEALEDDHEVHVVEGGDQAIQLMRDVKMDVVITDMVMPGKNGIDLILEIQQQFPSLPVIAMSGGGGIAGRFDYLSIAKLKGARKIIKKPFSLSDIRSAVAEVVSL